jgi:hypothetical protein
LSAGYERVDLASRGGDDAVMTQRTDFTDEEWARIKRAPFVAGAAITLADPGGPIEAFHETKATLKTVVDAAQDGGTRGAFVQSVAADVVADAQARHNPLGGFKPQGGANAGVAILDELRDVNEIVTAKADAEDAQSYRQWLLDAAREAAEAAKEGGFMGFHAERVSEGEQRMLTSLAGVLKA